MLTLFRCICCLVVVFDMKAGDCHRDYLSVYMYSYWKGDGGGTGLISYVIV